MSVLPEFTSEGDLPSGVHLADWQQFESRFGTATPRRVWLFGRLKGHSQREQEILEYLSSGFEQPIAS